MYFLTLSVVNLVFVYVGVVYHLSLMFIANVGYNIGNAPLLIVVVIIAITHPITSGYTSMLAQAMIHRARALGKSEAKVKQVEIYIRWLSHHPVAIVLNFIVYLWQFASYVIIVLVTSLTINGVLPPTAPGADAIRAMILIVSVLALVLTSWLLINFIYGSLKRLGSVFSVVDRIGAPLSRLPVPSFMEPIQFNNKSYSKALNKIISDCGGGFQVDDFVRRRV